jgi:hypothetical protein
MDEAGGEEASCRNFCFISTLMIILARKKERDDLWLAREQSFDLRLKKIVFLWRVFYGFSRIFHGFSRIFTDFCGFLQIFSEFYGFLRMCTVFRGILRIFADFYEYSRNFTFFYECVRFIADFYGFSRVFLRIYPYFTVFRVFPRMLTVSYGFTQR